MTRTTIAPCGGHISHLDKVTQRSEHVLLHIHPIIVPWRARLADVCDQALTLHHQSLQALNAGHNHESSVCTKGLHNAGVKHDRRSLCSGLAWLRRRRRFVAVMGFHGADRPSTPATSTAKYVHRHSPSDSGSTSLGALVTWPLLGHKQRHLRRTASLRNRMR